MKKLTFHSKCQALVNKFCGGNPYISWGKEIKIAQKLLRQETDFSFWQSLDPSRISSLSWFLTDEGKLFLKASKLKVNLVLPEVDNPAILQDKIGEDKNKAPNRPKTLQDFLKKYEED